MIKISFKGVECNSQEERSENPAVENSKPFKCCQSQKSKRGNKGWLWECVWSHCSPAVNQQQPVVPDNGIVFQSFPKFTLQSHCSLVKSDSCCCCGWEINQGEFSLFSSWLQLQDLPSVSAWGCSFNNPKSCFFFLKISEWSFQYTLSIHRIHGCLLDIVHWEFKKII